VNYSRELEKAERQRDQTNDGKEGKVRQPRHRYEAPGAETSQPNKLLFGKSRQLRSELTGRRVHLRSKKHRILQKAICNSFLQFLQIFPDDVKT
jgi:hypothetical protein